MEGIEKRGLMISRGWIQAAAIVLIFGFFILGVLTYYTYNDEPPMPDIVKSTNGSTLFTRDDIMAGQQIFLGNGLMEYGSIFGHGAYLGPDFTAEYLHRAALSSIDFYGGANSDTARSRTIQDFKNNRYDNATGMLVYTDAQTHAFNDCRAYYASFFGEPSTKFGLRPSAIRYPEEIRKLTAFFSWSAWAASAARPGHPYSYTNNWPPEPLIDRVLLVNCNYSGDRVLGKLRGRCTVHHRVHVLDADPVGSVVVVLHDVHHRIVGALVGPVALPFERDG